MNTIGEVLLVEDHPVIGDYFADLLQRMGVPTVHRAETAADGWRLLLERDVRLAVVDWALPGGTGLGFLRRCQAERRAVRCLMCTGFAVPGLVREAMESGAVGVVSKTSDRAALMRAFRAWLAGADIVLDAVTTAGMTGQLSREDLLLLEKLALGRPHSSQWKRKQTLLAKLGTEDQGELIAAAMHHRAFNDDLAGRMVM